MPNAQTTTAAVDNLAERAATKAAAAIDSTKNVTNRALDSLQGGVDSARQTVPEAFGRAAAQVEELTRRGLDRARSVSSGVKDQVSRAGDQTTPYARTPPGVRSRHAGLKPTRPRRRARRRCRSRS